MFKIEKLSSRERETNLQALNAWTNVCKVRYEVHPIQWGNFLEQSKFLEMLKNAWRSIGLGPTKRELELSTIWSNLHHQWGNFFFFFFLLIFEWLGIWRTKLFSLASFLQLVYSSQLYTTLNIIASTDYQASEALMNLMSNDYNMHLVLLTESSSSPFVGCRLYGKPMASKHSLVCYKYSILY